MRALQIVDRLSYMYENNKFITKFPRTKRISKVKILAQFHTLQHHSKKVILKTQQSLNQYRTLRRHHLSPFTADKNTYLSYTEAR